MIYGARGDRNLSQRTALHRWPQAGQWLLTGPGGLDGAKRARLAGHLHPAGRHRAHCRLDTMLPTRLTTTWRRAGDGPADPGRHL